MKIKHIKYTILAMMIVMSTSSILHAKEFLDTIFQFNLFVTVGAPFGAIPTVERTAFDSYWTTDAYNGETKYYSLYNTSFGAFFDLVPMPAIILGNESHAIKFGIRGGFKFGFIYQNLNVPEKDINYTGTLLTYKEIMVGPVMHYAPSIGVSSFTGNYNAKGGFTLFVLWGYLFDSSVNAFPLIQFRGGSINGTYASAFSGWKIEAGIGGQIAVSAINIGMNVYYSYTNITLDTAITDYGSVVSTVTELHEICFDIYIGIPVEWGPIAVSWPEPPDK